MLEENHRLKAVANKQGALTGVLRNTSTDDSRDLESADTAL